MILNHKEEEITLERKARDLEIEELRKQVKDKESEVINLLNQLQTIPNGKRINSACKVIDPKADTHIEELKEYLKLKDDQLSKLTHDINDITDQKDQEINSYKLQFTHLKNFIQETSSDTLKVLLHQLESLYTPQNSEKLDSIKDILHNFDTMLKDILKSSHSFFTPIHPNSIITPGEIPISKHHEFVPYCIICSKILDMDEFILSKCSHSIHSRCLKYNILNCPECLSEIIECDYIRAAEQSFIIISDMGKLCRDTSNLKKCPGGCCTMVSIENDSFIFDCYTCKKAYCLKCQQEAHPGDICKVVISDSQDANLCRICSEEMIDNMITLQECHESFNIECIKQGIFELLQDGKDARCACGAGIAAEDYTIIMRFD